MTMPNLKRPQAAGTGAPGGARRSTNDMLSASRLLLALAALQLQLVIATAAAAGSGTSVDTAVQRYEPPPLPPGWALGARVTGVDAAGGEAPQPVQFRLAFKQRGVPRARPPHPARAAARSVLAPVPCWQLPTHSCSTSSPGTLQLPVGSTTRKDRSTTPGIAVVGEKVTLSVPAHTAAGLAELRRAALRVSDPPGPEYKRGGGGGGGVLFSNKKRKRLPFQQKQTRRFKKSESKTRPLVYF